MFESISFTERKGNNKNCEQESEQIRKQFSWKKGMTMPKETNYTICLLQLSRITCIIRPGGGGGGGTPYHGLYREAPPQRVPFQAAGI